MHKKLTITLEEDVYRGLYQKIGKRRISHFIEELVRPHVLRENLEDGYRALAADETAAAEADEWSEGLIGDVADAAW